ncbi:dihydroxyacetone kinase phosphoryl donor subunit DhaM [Anaeroselena agilis]|uniref:phosphoenolpyruvate--glycerone phosphotransferase n=1 Tax=Anaeroselena agilis TaxID=3063788 RepID=A0ABU3P1Z2_9FIRM|nr:dihydroxyacetone kinase phosphoryl donor subunit DhaM [Selenomonadales bacterium 4137-cl]
MVGIVIVSHSAKIAEGIRDMAVQMAKPGQKIVAAGGAGEGVIGTDAVKIYEAIKEADLGDGVVVLVDLGSAILSTETALELLDEDTRMRVRIADAPVVEGAISAAVQASLGGDLTEVAATAEGARELHKK